MTTASRSLGMCSDPSTSIFYDGMIFLFADEAALTAWLTGIAADPAYAYMVYVDRGTGRAGGMGAFMSMAPAGGAIEIGSIILAPPMRRTRRASEDLPRSTCCMPKGRTACPVIRWRGSIWATGPWCMQSMPMRMPAGL